MVGEREEGRERGEVEGRRRSMGDAAASSGVTLVGCVAVMACGSEAEWPWGRW